MAKYWGVLVTRLSGAGDVPRGGRDRHGLGLTDILQYYNITILKTFPWDVRLSKGILQYYNLTNLRNKHKVFEFWCITMLATVAMSTMCHHVSPLMVCDVRRPYTGTALSSPLQQGGRCGLRRGMEQLWREVTP